MLKHDIFQGILERGMVAIVRTDSGDTALRLAEACIAGGVTALEVTCTTPDAFGVLKALQQRYDTSVLLGAGTVLDPETARLAILAGAKFIISPNVDIETIKLCQRYQVLSMPGAMTPTEIVTAMEAGADIVKLFPADAFGPSYLKALRAPLPHAPLMPTGGVNLDNLGAWFECGAVAVGIGSSLTAPAENGDYAALTSRAKAFVDRMKQIKEGRTGK